MVREDESRDEGLGKYVYCIVKTEQERDFGPIGIGEGGNRVYAKEDILRLKFILKLKELGISLRLTKKYALQHPESRHAIALNWSELA